MALAFILLGIIAVVVAIRNTYADLGNLIAGDLGDSQFWAWLIAIGVIVAVGYIPYFRTMSRWFLALVILVFVLKNGTGFFDQLRNSTPASSSTQSQADQTQNPNVTSPLPVQLQITGSGGAAGAISGGIGAVKTLVSFVS